MRLVRIVEQELRAIDLPSIFRPPIGPNDPATEELVRWAITFHVYAEIAHIRTVLAGLIVLADAGNTPSASILARHLFEWTAMACYLVEKLKEVVANKQWQPAFEIMLQVDTGNSWVKTHGRNYDNKSSFPEDVARPIRIKHLIAAYTRHHTAQYGSAKVEDSYGYLSEYSHPNSACLLPYKEFSGARAFFAQPAAESAVFGGINGFIVEWLMFAQELLGFAGENTVRDRLIRTLPLIVEAEMAK
jgi:hypothetical protein